MRWANLLATAVLEKLCHQGIKFSLKVGGRKIVFVLLVSLNRIYCQTLKSYSAGEGPALHYIYPKTLPTLKAVDPRDPITFGQVAAALYITLTQSL